MKKAQITPFIVIGLILLTGITIFLIVKDGGIKTLSVPNEISPVYSSMQSCIEKNLEDSIEYISSRGGYYDLPENSNDMEIAYYIYKNENLMPSKEKLGEEIGKYINNDILFCLDDFSENSEFFVQSGDPNSTIEIKDNEIIASINYPLSITKNNKTYFLNNFETKTETRLGIIYRVVKQIIDEQISNKDGICIDCLYDLSVENNLTIKTLDYNEDMIYIINDELSKSKENPLVFNFVNKYN
jgi:hypothetical protein